MKNFLPLWQREMAASFRTSIAYVVGVFFLLLTGFTVWALAVRLASEAADGTMAGLLFGAPWFWPALLLVAPLLTMRLFAEERRTGTLETLLTAPVTETEVVLAKFAGAYATFLLLWAPTLAYALIVEACGVKLEALDWGPVATGYLGTALVGAYFLAMGLLCSLLTRHQIVAAMACLSILGLLLAAGLLALQSPDVHIRLVSRWISSSQHMEDFAAGVIDTRAVFGYLSATVLLLFISIRLLEARRLR